MRTIDRGDLDCLAYNLRKGHALRPLRPRSSVWGRNCSADKLEYLLRETGPEISLRETLVVAHLLYPETTPAWARPWLLSNASGVMGAELAILEQAQWRMFAVPVADGQSGYVRTFLAGAGQDLPLVAAASERAFALDSLSAMGMADQLVRARWGGGCCFALISPVVSSPVISGPSLGLPCYLAAAACLEGLDAHRILSTGQLDDSGAVLPVQCINAKLDAAGLDFDMFLYPQGTMPPESQVECVPVSHVSEALAVMACYRPGMGLKIALAERALRSGQSLAREICSFHAGMAPWLLRNREAIATVLETDSDLVELVGQLDRWCDSTFQCDPELGCAVLQCISLDVARTVGTVNARRAWSVCVLQLDRLNHAGRLAEFKAWKELSDELRPRIMSFGDAPGLLALNYVQSVIGDMHNRYYFVLELPEDDVAMYEVRSMQRAFDEGRTKVVFRENTTLGRYYGTVGQHYGFCGPDYIEECLRHLDFAISCFCGESPESATERDRDMLYKVFALSCAGRPKEAEEVLRGIPRCWDGRWSLEKMDSYQIHALLRVHTDAGNGLEAGLWQEIADRWRCLGRRCHPWQLIAYNLGLLAPDRAAAGRMFKDSLSLCLSREAGPTIQVMALLPLARLHAGGHHLDGKETMVRQALEPVRDNLLSADHFASLMQTEAWADLLTTVQRDTALLFPYSYR